MNTKKSFITRVCENISRFAKKEAVKVGDVSMTYSELDEKSAIISNRLNEHLASIGVPAGQPVRIGVFMNKSEWLVPSVWAILRNGYTYVPIDKETPKERISAIIDDSQLQVVLVNNHTKRLYGDISVINVSDGYVPQEQYQPISCDNDTAYIIYTSGTTGIPKGIPISYTNMTTFLESLSCPELFGISSDSVLMLFASINFDTSIAPLIGALYYGAKDVIALEDERTDAMKLTSLMISEQVTYVCLPPTLLGQLMTYEFPAMKTLVSAGEPLIQSAADKAMGHSYRLINAYGPTECTVFATFRDVSPDAACDNIGVALPHVVTYVIDKDFHIAADGEIGELLLGGPQLTQGYINRPELNQKAFVQNPFAETREVAPMLYHTGDLVRRTADGTLDYIGRMDSQVKIRSFRVELNEIKHHIERQPQVQQSYVRIEKIGTESHIVAYILFKEGYDANVSSLKEALTKTLPYYMIPNYMVVVDHFELNVNGKVDKTKLRNTLIEGYTRNNQPKTAAETTIASIIAGACGVEDVNIDTDLIDQLGMSSIQQMQAIVTFMNAGVPVSANDLYTYRTIRRLAAQSADRHYYWLEAPVKEKPVMILISGYTSYDFLYRKMGNLIKDKYNIFVIESYHDNLSLTPRTTEEYIEEYLQVVTPVVQEYGIDVITGFCLGGEMGLYLASKLQEQHDIRPHVVVLDGLPNRFKDGNKNVPLIWYCLSKELNNRRVAQDNCIIETMPDFHYSGPVTSILCDEYQNNNPDILDVTAITEEQDYWEHYMFEHAEESWRKCYPESEIIIHRVGHYDYLIDEERSIKPLADYFNQIATSR